MSLKCNAIRLAEELKHAQWPVERIDFTLDKLRILRNGEAHDRPDIHWQDWQQEVTGTAAQDRLRS